MAAPRSDEPGRPVRRGFEPWPWALAGLVVSMISISMSLYFIASANVDAVVGDAWEAGLAFNDDLAARRSALASGAALRVEALASEEGAQLAIVVEGAEPQQVSAWRIRPAQAGFDEELSLRLDGGVWRGAAALPRPGRWRFRVTADLPDGRLQREVDVYAPGPGAAP